MENVGEYEFKELAEKALETGAPEDLNNLGEWFQNYGSSCWNGECWEIDKNNSLRPVMEENEDGDFEIVGYELGY